MPIEMKMPALSPTMEDGTLARWLVKEGDRVRAGDVVAEIETDKATMEFEAAEEGTLGRILVAAGTDGVAAGTVIAWLDAEGDSASAVVAPMVASAAMPDRDEAASVAPADHAAADDGTGGISPLALRIATGLGIDPLGVTGSGPGGRIVKRDVMPATATAPVEGEARSTPNAIPLDVPAGAGQPAIPDVPHTAVRLSTMRRTIARRLTESKQQAPHIYLTVDVRIDALLALRGELNAGLAARGVKLSVNDLMVKALAMALIAVPACNVMYTPDRLIAFARADIAVAVSAPGGLFTPVVTAADTASLSSISTRIADLAAQARAGVLSPDAYAGGTASISNMGMYGITQFAAVLNPPQATILAIGAGGRRPWVIDDGSLASATVLSATGSFDHRAIDGADAAELMRAFKALVEQPLSLAV
jgi:pyruvate dehydrogenase E2 component (dihydrolipoamide acetyltransferase)